MFGNVFLFLGVVFLYVFSHFPLSVSPRYPFAVLSLLKLPLIQFLCLFLYFFLYFSLLELMMLAVVLLL